MKTHYNGDVLPIIIDGHMVLFCVMMDTWHCFDPHVDVRDKAAETAGLLNKHRNDPAVRLWLSSGQYGGMSLSQYLTVLGVLE